MITISIKLENRCSEIHKPLGLNYIKVKGIAKRKFPLRSRKKKMEAFCFLKKLKWFIILFLTCFQIY